MVTTKKLVGNIPIKQLEQEVDDFINEVKEDNPIIAGGVFSDVEDIEGRSEVTTDAEGKIISYRDADGVKHENIGMETNHLSLSEEGMTEFQQALKESGFRPGGAGDWSDYISKKGKDPLHLPLPRLAYVNLTNAEGNLTWPTSKSADLEAIIEFNDMQGNYFKKNVIFTAQGNSSMIFPKKNGSIKMFDGSVYNSKGKKGKGDKFGVKFGDLVSQTTYHVKASYTDYFRGVNYIAYKVALAVANTRDIFSDRPWKKGLFNGYTFSDNIFDTTEIDDANLQIDNGALCQPDGFPCIMFLNGEFYGIYAWLIKKDAANFNMEDTENHIHLDGVISDGTLLGANGDASLMSWNPTGDKGFEVRNPETLVVFDGTEYNADIDKNQELAGIRHLGDSIDNYNASTTYAKNVLVTVNNRVYLSLADDNVNNNPEDAKSTKHDKVFDNATDYWIDVTFTNEVKKKILLLSTYKSNIESASTLSDKKALYEEYYDLDNQIDYEVVQMATGDTDGFIKNWQWTTWDGKKWFINNYDKDHAFGCIGVRAIVPNITGWNAGASFVTAFLVQNYDAELKARWTELVNKGIFTKEYIIGLFNNWCKTIGSVNFGKEYEKWPESPCNRDSGISDKWKIVDWEYTISPVTTYDANHQYEVGETCIITTDLHEKVTYECQESCINVYPISKTYTEYPQRYGYRDSLWRVSKYIEDNLNQINNFVNS